MTAPPQISASSSSAAGALRVAVAASVALGVSQGIGRFAFTPLLPMMLHDGLLALPLASWLATANYAGYLVGALLCMRLPRLRARPVEATLLARVGLAATALATLGMALAGGPAAWLTLRFLAGVVSAVAFVFTLSWALGRLAQAGRPGLGGLIFAGPGAGIVLTGVAASGMVAAGWSSMDGWMAFAAIALLLTLAIWPQLRAAPVLPDVAPGAADAAPTRAGAEAPLLALAYGLAGFGYIITATFLPVIARSALPDSALLELFWPLFGVGVMAGALLAIRAPARIDRRLLLAFCYLLQAAGVLTTLWLPSLAGFAVGSLLIGLPFTAISFFGMQEARRLRPRQPASFMGLMTALYGLGQIAGPPLVALLLRGRTPADGFALSLEVAAGALLLGAGLYVWLARARPI